MTPLRVLVMHPLTSFTASHSRVALYVAFERFNASWMALGHRTPSAYAVRMIDDAARGVEKDGFTEDGAEQLSIAILYSSWLSVGRNFEDIHGVVANLDGGKLSIAGFSEERWNEIVQAKLN